MISKIRPFTPDKKNETPKKSRIFETDASCVSVTSFSAKKIPVTTVL